MIILLASAELDHFAKVGGLADISAALPRGWADLGHEPIVIVPKYQCITDSTEIHSTNIEFTICNLSVRVFKSHLPESTISVYLLECDELYDRPGIYGNPDGYEDNDLRFYVLCKAAFELMIELNISPDVISAHDYHTALLMPLLKIDYARHPLFLNTKGVLTIHNAQYQGWYDNERIREFSHWEFIEKDSHSPFLFHDHFNALYSGINFSDAIIAVSPGYANEILTEEYGAGLHEVFNNNRHKLSGILNGVNYGLWNPSDDCHINQHFTILDKSGKVQGKKFLLQSLFDDEIDLLPDSLPVFGIVSRFTEQKGFELLEDCIENCLKDKKIRLIVLGSGDARYEDYFSRIQNSFPGYCSYTRGYDEELAHRILAYADFFLMPSLFEPCGLTQLYAMKYGTIPIVRHVGGLKDTIEDFNQIQLIGNGITFSEFTSSALLCAIDNAIDIYGNKSLMNPLIDNAMHCDYSIHKTAIQYIELFETLKARH